MVEKKSKLKRIRFLQDFDGTLGAFTLCPPFDLKKLPYGAGPGPLPPDRDISVSWQNLLAKLLAVQCRLSAVSF